MLKYVNFDIVFQEIPDEVTLAINLSNCPNRCKGCHSPYLMEDVGEPLTAEVLVDLLSRYGQRVTCICFMGGDSAPDEVCQLATIAKSYLKNIKVGWYSGRNSFPSGISLHLFNYVKLGAYVESLGNLRSKTTNQKLYKIGESQSMEDVTYKFWQDQR